MRRAIAIRGAEQARFSLAERMAHYRVPGVSVAVIDGCRIADSRGFGRSAGNGPPITPRTLFQAGSISKSVTAVAALRLVGEGKIPLESDVRPLVKSWAADSTADARAHPVTLRQLLNHSAGVTEMGGKGYVRGTPLPAIAEIVNGKTPANNPPVRIEREPGTSWAYSSGGYHVVQALMEEATGEPFALLAERLVLRPAKMRDSTFAQPLEPARLPLAASAAGPDGSPLEGSWRVNPELAAGGLWTNPTDFARFLIALTNDIRGGGNRLLGPRMSREMFSPGLSNWGLGVQLNAPAGPRRIGHTGHNVGFVSEFVIYPDTCQGAVVMTNADQGGWLVTEILNAMRDIYRWPEAKASPVETAISMSDRIAERFVGTYQLRNFPSERFTISRKPDGGLYWARVGHVGRDLLAKDAGSLFSPDSRMTLDADPASGRAKSLELGFGGGTNVADRVE